jgi:signal transduction histidine kinase
MEAETPLPLVNADSSRVLQVLSNLIGNAIKYSPPGATVSVGATQTDGEVTLWVRDSGSGISPEHVPHIFDRFWHLRGTSRTGGTGLGLAIARGIVTAHGGRIWVDSTLGVGSTFYFTLPVAGDGERAGQGWRNVGNPPTGLTEQRSPIVAR